MDAKPAPWKARLIATLNALAEEFGLGESEASRLRAFVLDTAKAQYASGNKAGIYWARNGKNRAPGAA